ncbi:hypothetical protein KTQ94_04240 [Prevotella stercorea]|uniref:hypothetical protein n=1 Tax=Leyella stercorea TaxID=363265 RepID=UPI001C2C58B4|nr:hypothetical protein [Leyella stercorea]MBU9897908.1 hypothetical protein [Leyella stercorea]MBU9946015.1 hypothetical protein [Leyella stercorea]DAI28498.1 MAG TPA: DNA repair protein [Caudoviricetes sp.]
MIKPEDLRIGDIVKVKTVSGAVKLCIVQSLMQGARGASVKEINNDNNGYTMDISPIHLTLELLEKNGFKEEQHQKDGASEWYDFYHYDLGINIVYEVEENKFAAYLDCKKLREIQYAHELQHILWALGLNAELKV